LNRSIPFLVAEKAFPHPVALPAETPSLLLEGILLRPFMAAPAMGRGQLVCNSDFNSLSVSSHKNVTSFSKALVKRHSFLRSFCNGIGLKPAISSQVSKPMLDPFDFDKNFVRFVHLLLNMSSPSTIRRFVVAIIINPVKRMTVWPLSHIFNKVGEHVPSIAYRYPSTTVSMPHAAVGVPASVPHVYPSVIKRVTRLTWFTCHYCNLRYSHKDYTMSHTIAREIPDAI
jgi:hypothetical protein